jgi:vancomycin resistance protein VanJ
VPASFVDNGVLLRRYFGTFGRWLAVTKPIKNLITAAIGVYFALLFAWLAAYLLSGDQIPLLAGINMLAVYLFFPLPLVILSALLLRRTSIWIATAMAAGVFAWLWGGQLIPKSAVQGGNPGSGPSLSVMTYNLLGYHSFADAILDNVRAENPDLVLVQELNPQLAAAMQNELMAAYPYQVLDPHEGVAGMGVISRHPISPSGEDLMGEWPYAPQILDLEWQGQVVKVINIHMVPTTSADAQVIARTFQLRESQARSLVNYAAQAGPLIVGGDANATPHSDVHRLLTLELVDAWQAAGFGPGHTFPGSDIPGSSRPHIAGRPVPMWLARIDYVFHSSHWETQQAHAARFDGVSDHRGVVAELVLDPGD